MMVLEVASVRSASPARKDYLCDTDANRPIKFPFIFMNEIALIIGRSETEIYLASPTHPTRLSLTSP